VFITLAIPFGGSTGAEYKSYSGHDDDNEQNSFHTFFLKVWVQSSLKL
jgi:hypothetical protein